MLVDNIGSIYRQYLSSAVMVRGQRRVRFNKTNGGDHITIDNLPSDVQTVKITNYFSVETNGENDVEGKNEIQQSIRMSPRKHPSTLSVLQQQNNNNTPKKSPHKIEINYDLIIDNLAGVVSENAALTPQPPKKQQKVQRKVTLKETSAAPCKLTDYFPVRRSVRKTKKAVQEEKKRELELSVLSETEYGLSIKYFANKGRGVVATKSFSRGDFVVEYAGDLISVDDARDREIQYANDSNTGCYMYYFVYRNSQMCVDATAESSRLGRLVNHSRQGNLTTKIIEVDSKPRLVLIAKEDILEGSELTYDYGDRSKESLKYHPWLAF